MSLTTITRSSGSRTATSLDDDPARIENITAAVAYLAHESYWALGGTHEEMEAIVAEATRVVGLYAPNSAMVGFARVISDRVKLRRGSATCTSSSRTARGRPRGRRSRGFTSRSRRWPGCAGCLRHPPTPTASTSHSGSARRPASVMEHPQRR